MCHFSEISNRISLPQIYLTSQSCRKNTTGDFSTSIEIAVQGLSFTYPRTVTKALDNVSFDVKKGEVFGIMGANGSGKTTLCYALNGVIPNVIQGYLSGEVTVAGLRVFEETIDRLSSKVGMLLDDPEGQLICADVLSEVSFGPENLGLPRDEILSRGKWALGAVRLSGFETRLTSELSGGQKQRLALASIFTMLPEVLILDEPTSQMDPIGTDEVIEVIRDLRKERNMTIILVTHKSEEIVELADRLVILEGGRVAKIGSPSEVFNQVDSCEELGIRSVPVTKFWTLLKKKGLDVERLPIETENAVRLMRDSLRNRKLLVRKLPPRQPLNHANAQPILEMKDVTYTYPGPPPVTAVRDVNLKFYEKEFVGIIGQNGSGKTTLVKNFLNILAPTEGKVLFRGEDISKQHIAQLATKIGLILQNPDNQLFALSSKEEVEFGLRNLGKSPEQIAEKVKESLSFAGLEQHSDEFPFKLSFGDRRKLVVAAIAAMEPEVIILDEPTTGQDYLGRYSIMDLARKLNDQGTTVIAITHDMDLIAEYANRCVVMSDGAILVDGPTWEVFSQPEVLAKTYLRPPQITMFANELVDVGADRGILTVEEMLKSIEMREPHG